MKEAHGRRVGDDHGLVADTCYGSAHAAVQVPARQMPLEHSVLLLLVHVAPLANGVAQVPVAVPAVRLQ